MRHLDESLQRLPDVLGSDLPGHEVDDLGRMTGVDLYGNASRRAGQGSKDVVIEPIDIYGKEIEPVGEPDALEQLLEPVRSIVHFTAYADHSFPIHVVSG